MVTHSITETYENDSLFDLAYIICVWITFLPTVSLPWFYSHWVLIGSLSRQFIGMQERKERLGEQESIFGNTL